MSAVQKQTSWGEDALPWDVASTAQGELHANSPAEGEGYTGDDVTLDPDEIQSTEFGTDVEEDDTNSQSGAHVRIVVAAPQTVIDDDEDECDDDFGLVSVGNASSILPPEWDTYTDRQGQPHFGSPEEAARCGVGDDDDAEVILPGLPR